MIFFTTLGIVITLLLLYVLLFNIIILFAGGFDQDNIFMAAIVVGVIISFIVAIFITEPKAFGYQKITVSENTVEENK